MTASGLPPMKVAARAEPFVTSKASDVLPSPETLTLPSILAANDTFNFGCLSSGS